MSVVTMKVLASLLQLHGRAQRFKVTIKALTRCSPISTDGFCKKILLRIHPPQRKSCSGEAASLGEAQPQEDFAGPPPPEEREHFAGAHFAGTRLSSRRPPSRVQHED